MIRQRNNETKNRLAFTLPKLDTIFIKNKKMEFTRESLFKLWDVSVMSMSPDVAHEVSETPYISSYSIQLPSFTEEPTLCNIQATKMPGEKAKLSIIIGSYIEYHSVEITDEEFIELTQKFTEKNEIIELEIRQRLVQKAEKNLEILLKSI